MHDLVFKCYFDLPALGIGENGKLLRLQQEVWTNMSNEDREETVQRFVKLWRATQPEEVETASVITVESDKPEIITID